MTIDVLKLDGKIPVCSDAFIIFVKMGVNVWQQSFTKDVGTGSSFHCWLGHVRTNRSISFSLAGANVSILECARKSNYTYLLCLQIRLNFIDFLDEKNEFFR